MQFVQMRAIIKKVCLPALHFVGVIPVIVFAACVILLLPIGITVGRVFPCCYYPCFGPFANIEEFGLTLHFAFTFMGPLLLWRYGFRGRNRIVRIFVELWFSLPWAFSGCVGYFLDFVCKH